ncbi:hypothetical protein P9281_34970 [Caballeronia sp. LP003]|uniref:hypothetical protein n=1 Tax=Caballeronia sp. LP003 TaxID=3038551 RepID=UPI00285A56A5|nr:hypothetical protein [Caballeronia sp. LP003]MDR5791753.1 hypothetical protein [Caballeronia sp. LP003]
MLSLMTDMAALREAVRSEQLPSWSNARKRFLIAAGTVGAVGVAAQYLGFAQGSIATTGAVCAVLAVLATGPVPKRRGDADFLFRPLSKTTVRTLMSALSQQSRDWLLDARQSDIQTLLRVGHLIQLEAIAESQQQSAIQSAAFEHGADR